MVESPQPFAAAAGKRFRPLDSKGQVRIGLPSDPDRPDHLAPEPTASPERSGTHPVGMVCAPRCGGRSTARLNRLLKRLQAIKTAALSPKIHREIWDKYNGRLPSDTSLRIYLLTERDVPFNKDQVDRFISQLRGTIAFAKLDASDKLPPAGDGAEADDVDGGEIERPPERQQQQRRRPMQAGTKEDVFTLEEGQVVLQYPESLSKESFEDFESWLELVVRKAKRSIRTERSDDGPDE